MPTGRMLAAAFTLTVTVTAELFGGSVPLVEETFSQEDVLIIPQLTVAAPALVIVKLNEAGVNGPPFGPVAVNPVAGSTCKPFGGAKRLMSPLPLGVPQPVQRS